MPGWDEPALSLSPSYQQLDRTHTHKERERYTQGHTHSHPTCRSATESGRISSVTAISSPRMLTTSSVSIHVQRLNTSQAFTHRSLSLTYGRRLQRRCLQRRRPRRLFRCLQSVCTACLSRSNALKHPPRDYSQAASALTAHVRCRGGSRLLRRTSKHLVQLPATCPYQDLLFARGSCLFFARESSPWIFRSLSSPTTN